MYIACCSPVSDRIQAARCLSRQLFDNYSCGSGDLSDKMVLENAHKLESTKLNKILSNGEKLCLSVQPLTRELYKKMCGILKEFFGSIDNKLPQPTILQVCMHASRIWCHLFYTMFSFQMIEKKSNTIIDSHEAQDIQCSSPNDKEGFPPSSQSHSQVVTRRYQTRRKRKIVPPERWLYSTMTNKSMKTFEKDQATDSDSGNSIVAESVTSSVIPKVTALANLI